MPLRNAVRLPLIQEIVFSEGGFTLLFLVPPIVITFLIASFSK